MPRRDRAGGHLDETIAVVLGIVGVKLLVADLVKIAPLPSLGIIGAALAGGIAVSLAADRRGAQARKKTNPSTT